MLTSGRGSSLPRLEALNLEGENRQLPGWFGTFTEASSSLFRSYDI